MLLFPFARHPFCLPLFSPYKSVLSPCRFLTTGSFRGSFWVHLSDVPFSFLFLPPLDSCHFPKTVLCSYWVQAVASTACFDYCLAYLLSRAFTFSFASSSVSQVLRISRIFLVWFSSARSLSCSPKFISSSICFSFPAPATLLVKVFLNCLYYNLCHDKSQVFFQFFRNLFTKYCCPFPVTSTVFVIRTLPSGLLIVLSFISNRPASILFCVGML